MQYGVLLAMIAALGTAWAQHAHRAMTVAEIVERDRWAVATGVFHRKPSVVRFREEFRSHPDVSAFPSRLTITWRYGGDDGSALPNAAQSALMEKFEDALIASLERDATAVLTVVITNDSTRQWVFYSADVSVCTERIRALPRDGGPYPISVTSERDLQWSFLYNDVLDGMRDKS